ncbi:glycosyltransferase [Arthrobacter sp. SLBN-112]|uniref:glycosyltransferase n=1 Tax=Arthrobacter sp. SLBN-112 TaxID=2768452 RepID=UPI0028118E1E|nr:glycosyltransferase [Arthrobacter sp. SLBN-112]
MTSGLPPFAATPRISVCMASYRGALYIEEQISSILQELGPNDELVIVDDASPDDTVEVIREFNDPRVRLIQNASNSGYVRTFEKAVLASKGEFIFLSDQDDVWVPGRVNQMLEGLQKSAMVATNFAMLGGGPRPWIPPLKSAMDSRRLANLLGIMIGYRAYYGCGMAFRRELIPVLTPIPAYVRESHDLWFAICGNVARSIVHLEAPSLLRRLHDQNETPSGFRSLRRIVEARLMLGRLLLEASRRLRRR